MCLAFLAILFLSIELRQLFMQASICTSTCQVEDVKYLLCFGLPDFDLHRNTINVLSPCLMHFDQSKVQIIVYISARPNKHLQKPTSLPLVWPARPRGPPAASCVSSPRLDGLDRLGSPSPTSP